MIGRRSKELTILQTDTEMRQGAELFAHLKQLLKLHMRQRDKSMMLQIIEEVRRLGECMKFLWRSRSN